MVNNNNKKWLFKSTLIIRSIFDIFLFICSKSYEACMKSELKAHKIRWVPRCTQNINSQETNLVSGIIQRKCNRLCVRTTIVIHSVRFAYTWMSTKSLRCFVSFIHKIKLVNCTQRTRGEAISLYASYT